MSSQSAKRAEASKPSVWERLVQFFREIWAELRKVQTPTRSELWQMFLTVTVFIAVIMLFVWGIDLIFGRLSLWIFG